MKYKPKLATKETPQPTKHKTGFKKLYASDIHGTNNENTNPSKEAHLEPSRTSTMELFSSNS